MSQNGLITHEAARFRHSHSDLLFLLAETGVIGALSVLLVYLAFGVAFVRRLSSPEPGIRSAAYAGTVTLGAYFAFGLADSMLIQTMQTAFLALAMTLMFAHIRQRERLAAQAPHLCKPAAP